MRFGLLQRSGLSEGRSDDLSDGMLVREASNREEEILTCMIGDRPLTKLWEKVSQFDQLAIYFVQSLPDFFFTHIHCRNITRDLLLCLMKAAKLRLHLLKERLGRG